jgi:uncharacterized membrane protein YdjX (TVP38/TMEM64 family)
MRLAEAPWDLGIGKPVQMSKRLIVVILSLLILVVIVLVFHLPIGDWLRSLLAWAERLGPWGPVLLVGLYVVAGVLLLPGSILTVGAGFLYGVPLAFLIVWIANTLGACTAFLVGRTIARDWVARRVARSEKFATLDEAVKENGFKIVLLTRLSPAFPYNFLNYAFGVSKIRFRQYAIATWLGLIPGILMYVYIGASLRPFVRAVADVEVNAQPTWAYHVFFWFGLAITVVVVVVTTRIARRALARTSLQHHRLPATASEPVDPAG